MHQLHVYREDIEVIASDLFQRHALGTAQGTRLWLRASLVGLGSAAVVPLLKAS